jgi:hypothetical protein
MLDWEWIGNDVVFYYNGKQVARCYDTDFNVVYNRLCNQFKTE